MPVAAAVISIVAAVAGGVMQTVQAKQTARAQEDAANYNAKVAGQQSAIAKDQARYDAEQIRERNRRVISSQRARYAASGITQTGSVLDVKRDSEIQGELEVMNRIYQGDLQAAGSNSQANLFRMEASQKASSQGLLTAAGAIGTVSSAAGAASTYPGFTGGYGTPSSTPKIYDGPNAAFGS